MREAERKRLIKEELHKQMMDKKAKENTELKENRAYDILAEEHAKLLAQREKEKADAVREKIMNDKSQRDQ